MPVEIDPCDLQGLQQEAACIVNDLDIGSIEVNCPPPDSLPISLSMGIAVLTVAATALGLSLRGFANRAPPPPPQG